MKKFYINTFNPSRLSHCPQQALATSHSAHCTSILSSATSQHEHASSTRTFSIQLRTITVALILLLSSALCFAQNARPTSTAPNSTTTSTSPNSTAVTNTSENSEVTDASTETKTKKQKKSKKKDIPVDPNKFYLNLTYGAAWSTITRIQKQETRSNFNWRNDLVGLFCMLETENLPLNFFTKVSAYYPYHYEFNKVKQVSKQIILYAIDFSAGPTFDLKFLFNTDFTICPEVYFRYQISDNFHHFDLGAGALASLKFPLTKGCSILLNGEFAYVYGNLGTNSKILPYDVCYNYNVQLGVRFSKRHLNENYYFGKKKTANDI